MTIYYSQDHEWISVEAGIGTVGITDYAQNALGDIVFVETPEVGLAYAKGDEVAVVESVKAASEILAPVSGEVVAINEKLADDPALVNSHAEADGWFYQVKISDTGELTALMDHDGYNAFVAGLE
ncbi:MAG: glycine cleavage system protein GcvH [Alphaproteobacteria bacterium]|nr:glycine cleavage system protein GcvH [Alphaproteobacteria bacterium]